MNNNIERFIKNVWIDARRKEFIENVCRIYEEYKYDTFYTKGIIYDSKDRLLSKNVIESMLSGTYELVDEDDNSVKILIPDDFSTTILLYFIGDQLHINITTRFKANPKVNKKAIEVLAFSLFEQLFGGKNE